jgi:hypothetical protein
MVFSVACRAPGAEMFVPTRFRLPHRRDTSPRSHDVEGDLAGAAPQGHTLGQEPYLEDGIADA